MYNNLLPMYACIMSEICTWCRIPYLYKDFGNWNLGDNSLVFIMNTKIKYNLYKNRSDRKLGLLLKELRSDPERCTEVFPVKNLIITLNNVWELC